MGSTLSRVVGSNGGGGRRSAAAACALAAGAGAAWAALRARPFRIAVEGGSMAPSLLPGDCLIATFPRGEVRRGAIVVVEDPRAPGFELAKRVRGAAGDLAPDGRRLGPGELWVEGDRTEASTDSRTFGAVDRKAIRGVVRLRYWPPGRIGVPR